MSRALPTDAAWLRTAEAGWRFVWFAVALLGCRAMPGAEPPPAATTDPTSGDSAPDDTAPLDDTAPPDETGFDDTAPPDDSGRGDTGPGDTGREDTGFDCTPAERTDVPTGNVSISDVAFFLRGGNGDRAGYAVAGADLDGDGLGDAFVGAPYRDSYAGGAWWVPASLGAVALADAPTHVASFGAFTGEQVAILGDTDGDGVGEIAVTAYGDAWSTLLNVWSGAPAGELTDADAVARFEIGRGSSLSARLAAGRGDVDGDGLADLVAGTAGTAGTYVEVWHGPVTGTGAADASFATPEAVAGLAILGDTDGDGIDDVAIGWSTQLYAVDVAFGPVTGTFSADATLTGSAMDGAGFTVAGGGDVDGDGLADLVVGGAVGDGDPQAWLVTGLATGKSRLSAAAAAQFTLEGPGGAATATATSPLDLDGDCLDDVILGAGGVASVYVYYGSVTGKHTAADADARLGDTGGNLGATLASAGDLDGDGWPDLLAGVWYAEESRVYGITGHP